MMENKTKIDLKNKSVFITGVAGFIGSNLARRLLSTVEGVKVVGLDNMNHYYDVRLKEARLNELEQFENFSFVKGNLADKAVIESIFEQYKPEIVVNLGAQAGVRYSITNPDAYVEANLIGFYNILEACRHSYDEGHTPVEHLVYAAHHAGVPGRHQGVRRQEGHQTAGLCAGSGWSAEIRCAQVPAGRQLLHRGTPLRHRAEAQDIYFN